MTAPKKRGVSVVALSVVLQACASPVDDVRTTEILTDLAPPADVRIDPICLDKGWGDAVVLGAEAWSEALNQPSLSR